MAERNMRGAMAITRIADDERDTIQRMGFGSCQQYEEQRKTREAADNRFSPACDGHCRAS
jgi:hypothetical protein